MKIRKNQEITVILWFVGEIVEKLQTGHDGTGQPFLNGLFDPVFLRAS